LVFSSPRFLIFLLVVLLVLSRRWKPSTAKLILAAFSTAFYAAWDYRYLVLLLSVSVIDYYCAARIARSGSPGYRRAWLLASVVSNLGILAFFKYYNFLAGNVNFLLEPLGVSVPFLRILLPAGISFYTFKSMSYTIDVYRRKIEPCQSQLDYTTFVTFFPELIAGPIVRASVFLPQMTRPMGPTFERTVRGGSLFLLGLTKKLLIADRLSTIADPIFAQPALYSAPTLWCAALAYSLQIYCDFSGYSDMAIGVAKMIGYDLPENFNMPYLSTSITEFWRRWHITLSSWLRDYLYIPLGGNQKGRVRTYINLMLTMLLGGLWHGASWNFVAWGLFHGVGLAAHKWYRERIGERAGLPAWLGGPITFLFVQIGWIPFRCVDFQSTGVMLSGMFGLRTGVRWYSEILPWLVALVVVGHVIGAWLSRVWAARRLERAHQSLGLVDASLCGDEISGWYVRLGTGTVAGSFLVVFWILFLYYFSVTHTSPFIYFQF
jgi:alginate O-acetyltransferase complex protein AlgI